MFGSDLDEGIPTPGENLVKLNPMRGLDDDQRNQMLDSFREMRPAFEDRDRRLELMDRQGIEAALVYGGTVSTLEYYLHDDAPTLWANIRTRTTGGSTTTGDMHARAGSTVRRSWR